MKDGRITYGGNSGHQAIHLACNFGASRILLLGYDFGGEGHWFGRHPTPNLDGGNDFEMWLRAINTLAIDLEKEGVEVVNYTRQTAIACFQIESLDA